MGLVVWGVAQPLAPWLDQGIALKVSALGAIVGAGLLSYFGLAIATRALERDDLRLLTRRKQP